MVLFEVLSDAVVYKQSIAKQPGLMASCVVGMIWCHVMINFTVVHEECFDFNDVGCRLHH